MPSLVIRSFYILFLTVVVTGAAGCSRANSGPEKFPVTGIVTVNGEPAERMAVLFHHEDTAISASHRYPTGVSDAGGVFHLSSTGDRDGAVAGSYRVTFTWLSSGDLDAFDMLNGEFAKPEASSFRSQIPEDAATPVKLDLKVSEEKILRTRPGRTPAIPN